MNQEYTFTVNAKEAEVILESIAEMPFKKVVDLFFKLRQQVHEAGTPNEAGNE